VGAPLITVCVPTIGRETYLAPMLESLKSQTINSLEILLLDNGSTGAARDVLERFAAQDARVRVLREEKPLSMFENFNRGIAAARGKYLTFFHDDDVYRPKFLERSIAFLEAHPQAALVGSNYEVIDAAGKRIGLRRHIRRTEAVNGTHLVRYIYRTGRNLFATQGVVYRTEALRGFGFDPRLPMHWGDFVVYLRIAERHHIGLLAEVLWANRRHSSAASAIPLRKAIALRTETFESYLAEYVRRNPERQALGEQLRRDLISLERRSLFWNALLQLPVFRIFARTAVPAVRVAAER
jgi:glycosyltransferase involved in cell wall biosynthesis